MIRSKIKSSKTIEELTAIYHQFPEWYQQLTSDFMQKKEVLMDKQNQPTINYTPNYIRYGNNAVAASQS